MTKGLVQTGNNGEMSWDVERGEQESGPNGGGVGLPVCNSWEDLMDRIFARDLVELRPLIVGEATELS